MLEALFVKENIVHIGAALYLAGFLFRDQIMLRTLIVIGDVVYILYFFFAPETPLWGGIFWSGVFIAVNTVMIARVVADRTQFGMTEEDRRLYRTLDVLTPGEFRRIMKLGRWRTAAVETVLTEENQPLEQLYFIVDGGVALDKAGKRLALPPGTFIGEVAFLLARPASATVTVAPGTRYIAWESAAVRRLLLREPSLRIAIGAALNRDMAAKVARA